MPAPFRRSRHSSIDPEDPQSYLEEALRTAQAMAGSLDYLARLHAAPGNPSLQALFSGLTLQANWVVNFLEEYDGHRP